MKSSEKGGHGDGDLNFEFSRLYQTIPTSGHDLRFGYDPDAPRNHFPDAIPVKGGAGVLLAAGRDVLVPRHGFHGQHSCQRPQKFSERQVLSVFIGRLARALELDSDGKVVAPRVPLEGRDAACQALSRTLTYCLTSPVRRTKNGRRPSGPSGTRYSGRFMASSPHEEGVAISPKRPAGREMK